MRRLMAVLAVLGLFAAAAPAQAQNHDPDPLDQDWTDISTSGGNCGDACCRCKKGCTDTYNADIKSCNQINVTAARVTCYDVAIEKRDRCILQCTADGLCA